MILRYLGKMLLYNLELGKKLQSQKVTEAKCYLGKTELGQM